MLLCSAGVHAEPAAKSKSKTSFETLSWDEAIPDLEYAESKDHFVPVSVLPNGRSQPYEYKETDPLVFYREIKGADGRPQRREAGTVQPESFSEDMLLIFFKTPNVEGHYDILAIDDSETSLPAGSYRFMNFSDKPLNIQCAADSGTVAPKQSIVLRGPVADGGQATPISISVTDAGVSKRVYSNEWGFGKQVRTLVMIGRDPATGAYDVKRMAQEIPAHPKPRRSD